MPPISVGRIEYGNAHKYMYDETKCVNVPCGRCTRPTNYGLDPEQFPEAVVLCGPCGYVACQPAKKLALHWKGTTELYERMCLTSTD